MPPSSVALSVGQLAQHWERPTSFVKGLIAEGKLQTNERGLITNESLRDYYRTHGVPI